MEYKTDLLALIKYIDPGSCNYQEWVNVGMALKEEGYSWQDWEQWSQSDSARYHNGECKRKWKTFNGAAQPVTGGTIYQMAVDRGYTPETAGHELDWNDTIQVDPHTILNTSWIEDQEIQEPSDKDWHPAQELITYLETLFGTDDNVGYATRSWSKPDEGKFYPDKGCWDRTAGRLIRELTKCNDDIGLVVGDYNTEVGAWIRFNPLDGKGCKNENVTEFRYALVESDQVSIEKQNAILRNLELPIAALVYSGNKSLHALVKVDAANKDEYRKRVEYLYKICTANGLEPDQQNKNPSRLSRMPGVRRGNHKQFLVATNIGKQTWEEWVEWIESVNDDLPDEESLASVWDNLPELSPCLIENILRQGHKMLLAGPSKAGKSFLQIEMCIAIAEGRKWLNWQCTQGRVLYVNLELDRASCLHRFKDVYEATGIPPRNLKNIDVWNLRGKSTPMDKLAPKLIRRALKKNYIAIIIDPIYKVITGDENSADQMAAFCNQFDKVCTELGCAVIYCHHHSKGAQNSKKSMDRASGSGVFARDPDALIDLIELKVTEELAAQEENKAVCATCTSFLTEQHINWQDDISQDDALSAYQMRNYCDNVLKRPQFAILDQQLREVKARVRQRTAWRVEGTLREFPRFDPVNIWFDYPTHEMDDTGALRDIRPDEDKPAWEKQKEAVQDRKKDREDGLRMAFEALDMDDTGSVKIADLVEYMGVTLNTVKKRINESSEFRNDRGNVVRRKSK